jgi:hypothetical protein
MSNNKCAKLAISTLLILLVCSSLTTLALAAPEEDVPQTAPTENSTSTDDGPTLYATDQENPVLIQGNDNETAPAEDGSASANENTEGDPNLISPRTMLEDASEEAPAKIGAVALAIGMGIIAAIAVILNRKKQTA